MKRGRSMTMFSVYIFLNDIEFEILLSHINSLSTIYNVVSEYKYLFTLDLWRENYEVLISRK